MSSEALTSRRRALHALLGLSLGAAATRAQTEPAPVWLVVSDRGDAYDEAVQTLRAELPGLNWRVLEGQNLPAPSPTEPPPRAIVTLGTLAYRRSIERAALDATPNPPPVLAGLLPRSGFEAVPQPRPAQPLGAVWLDPAVDRYLELIRRTMPERLRVGVLFGPTSRSLRPAVVKAAYDRGLEIVEATVQAEDFYPALAQVLREADVLLALPDNLVYNPGNLNNVLIAAYRQRVPVVTYAASHVRAGATLALHVTPAQAGRQLAALVRRTLNERRGVPPPGPSTDWSLAVNTQVARTLGIEVRDVDALLNTLRRTEGRS